MMFLNELILLLTVKWFQVLLYINNNSIKYQPFVYHIYPTPPLGQDMTQGQFLSGV